MSGPDGWWRAKSTPAKVETYTRWSFHSFAVIEAVTLGLPFFGNVSPAPAWLLFVLVCGHSALCATTSSRALDWIRGSREQPRRLSAALAAATFVIALVALTLEGTDWRPATEAEARVGTSLFVGVVAFGAGTLALATRNRSRMTQVVVGAGVGAGAVSFPLGLPGPAALVTAGVVLLAAGFLTFTAAFSVWLLNAVYELDEARETRARLAVAEERLRFGRDLHDVMGRNLAVIALKSELAVQLTRRGRPEAVEQMVEVQRIARDSQREVREVVRGYRDADLGAELAGAQGVLSAAGIDCEVTGSAAGLPAQVQSALGWVVREATTNVLRHGDAGRCAVSLRLAAGRVTLTVENDGAPAVTDSGCPGDGSPPRPGSGLAGLRERLGAVDGVLRAGPAGDGVFRLTAEVPLPPVPDQRASASSVPRHVSEVTP
ncbi:sensor histidine kinase [Streptomyces sp. Tue6028]|uniref:sensor histidine kinase n=1 Tax=Streptomyces sp. Tue6028 TaxID=2036037 RepID=UPI000BB3A3A5|nr:histidine kinase [Streptomyces sp. Tue6028]PBC62705.1 sensor histidine kinase [Streptomyces sp. Tue6028]